MLSGCFGSNAPADTSAEPVSAETSDAPAPPASAAAIASEDEHAAEKVSKPLRIAVSGTERTYSPFDIADGYTDLMHDLTGVRLMETTRSGRHVMRGIEGEKETYGGKSYEYEGAADIFPSYDEESGVTTFTVNLRSDIKFSDGETLDADDVIFTLYTLLDPSYSGKSALYGAGVVGAANYRYDSPIADDITEDEIERALASDKAAALIRERVMIPCLNEQYDAVQSYYGNAAYDTYTSVYPDARDLFVFFYSLNSEYVRGEDESREDVISDIADMYGSNYKLLASMTVGDDTAFDVRARAAAIECITAEKAEKDDAGEPVKVHVNSVSGIVKTGKFSLTVSARCSESELADALADIVIAPLHYYGSDDKYDPDAGKYGFDKGSAGEVLTRHTDAPTGAGAYRFTGHENGTVYLEANDAYYKGSPASKNIEIISSDGSSPAQMIADGIADVCFADGSAKTYEDVETANKSLEKVYAAAIGSNGYGYIGFNVNMVNIGGDPLSKQSCMLRKGIATAVKHFGAASVSEYFGEYGETTDYPISGGITADKTEEDYIIPYSVDAQGEPIYKDGMSDSDRREAVKAACLGFFEQAGYVLSEDGKVTAAPEGGRLEFSAYAAGGGTGSHPALQALTQASELLSEIGITLRVNDAADAGELWSIIKNGSHEIWAGAWNDTLRRMYEDGYSGIRDSSLEELIAAAEAADAENKQAAYMACYNKFINEWAAEIPLYKRTGCTLFSTLRVDVSSIPADMTAAYGWTDVIEAVRMK